jgi:hypothetical protein
MSEVALVLGRGLRRDREGRLRLPLRGVLAGAAGPATLVLTVVEAEQLHAALCYALDGEPVPAEAPGCREPVRYSGGRERY